MSRPVAVFLWVMAVAAASCSGGDGDEPTPANPPGVPGTARIVGEERALGSAASTPEGSDEPHLYFAMSCADDVLTIATSRETVYAELPCDRALPGEAAARFQGLPVLIRIVPSEPGKLYLDSATAGSAEFTVGRVWLEER